MRLLLLYLLALTTSCNCLYWADGAFMVHGRILDSDGKPVSGVRIKGRNKTVESDSDGCFELFEITGTRRHKFPFSVETTFGSWVSGTLPAPELLRVRIDLHSATSGFAKLVTMNPSPESLGLCEPRRPGQ